MSKPETTTSCSTVTQPNSTCVRNLDALRCFQPRVAHALDAVRLPNFECTIGRDGSQTCRVQSEEALNDKNQNAEKQWAWFGRSSMPQISAEAMTLGCHGQGGNMALPGILTGTEVRLLAGQCPVHVGFYVFEDNLANLRLALHIHDYEDLIRNKRLVLITGQDWEHDLQEFLKEHTGYELPAQILKAPQCQPALIDRLQRCIEHVGQRHATQIANRLEETSSRIGARPRPGDEAPRVAVVGMLTGELGRERTAAFTSALNALDWPHAVDLPVSPDRVHTLARLQTIERIQPHVVLFAGACPDHFRARMPENQPVLSWAFLDGRPAPPANTGPSDLWFVESNSERNRWLAGNVPADQVAVLDPGVDTAFYHPERCETQHDAVLFLDPPPDDPARCGIHLTSHHQLFQAMRETVAREPDAYRYENAERFLQQSETACGVQLREPQVRAHFLNLMQQFVAPSCVARSIGAALLELPIRAAVWGTNWPADFAPKEQMKGPVPFSCVRRKVFQSTHIVIMGYCHGAGVEMALQALSCGAQVLCRGDERELIADTPQFAGLAEHIRFYKTTIDLQQAVRTMLAVMNAKEKLDQTHDQAVVMRHHAVKEHSTRRRVESSVRAALNRIASPDFDALNTKKGM